MIFWFDSYFIYFMIGADLLVSVIGLWFTAVMPGIDRWSKHFFQSLFVIFVLLSIIGFLDSVMYSFPVPMWMMYVLIIIETVLTSLAPLMMTAYLVHCCGENVRSSRLFHAVMGLWGVFIVMLAVSPFTEELYYFTPDGRYWRGAWYPVLLLPMIAAMLLTLAGMIRRRERLSRKAFLSFEVTLFPITIVLVADMFVELYPLIDISIVIGALSMYSLILSDQVEQDLRRQREIANQRTSIMVLQMRPHFIYNTMTSIYCLCGQDPERARQVITDFTTYLRKNFTAIASAEPVPFTSELEHTQAYLAVEQAQYEDSLFVEYDIQHKMFRVPPLTLQPIVENAIKHGRDPYAGPFRIAVRTRRTDAGSEIVVEDNGRGFDAGEDSEPHIALRNIRERLEMMCGGEMTITLNNGVGTVVKVMIP